MFETYRPSGAFSFAVFPILIISVAIAVGAAYVYQLLLFWIPFIFLTFLLTIGFGVVISILAASTVSAGHVRNVSVGMIVGILLGLSGISAKYWFQYRSFLTTETDYQMELGRHPESSRPIIRELVENEFSFMDHIKLRVDVGWAIGGRGGGGGMPLTGFFVYLIWGIEALGVIGFATMVAKKSAEDPYSEKLNKWANERNVIMSLPINNQEMVERITNARDTDDLLDIPIPKSDESNQFALYTVFTIPGFPLEDAYLSVSLFTVNFDKDGKEQKTEKPLVKNAILTNVQRDQLYENAELLNEAITEYNKAKHAGQSPVDSEPMDPESTEQQ